MAKMLCMKVAYIHLHTTDVLSAYLRMVTQAQRMEAGRGRQRTFTRNTVPPRSDQDTQRRIDEAVAAALARERSKKANDHKGD